MRDNFMQILKKKLKNGIKMIIFKGIMINDLISAEELINIIKKLTTGEVYFYHFRSEDNFFLNDEELIKYRSKIPMYFKCNGNYQMNNKIDDERFDSIGQLEVNLNTFREIPELWKYFEGMTFFNPSKGLTWEEYRQIYNKLKPEEYGIGIIQSGYTDSVFIKGHDQDNLIFVYSSDFNNKLLDDVIQSVKKN
jgi:hypothetical protein